MARDLGDPPPLAPAQLWRSLLPLRPSRALTYRLRGAEGVEFQVRAVPAIREALARDAGVLAVGSGANAAAEQLRDVAGAREVLALVLYTPRGRAFRSARALGVLEDHELTRLVCEVDEALADIAPTYSRSNTRRWLEQLKLGAADSTNLDEAFALASCVDASLGAVVPRPDRYWGVPTRRLLDGHWMAYLAACDAMKAK